MNEGSEILKRIDKKMDKLTEYVGFIKSFQDNIYGYSELVGILQNKTPEELKELIRTLSLGLNQMAETKGEVRQMDERVKELARQRRWLTGLMITIGGGILITLVKFVFFDLPQFSQQYLSSP